MGVYSTVTITRKAAIKLIRDACDHLDDLSNDKLSELCFAIFRDSVLHNYAVMDTEEECVGYNGACEDDYVENFPDRLVE